MKIIRWPSKDTSWTVKERESILSKIWKSPSKRPSKIGYYLGKYRSVSGKIRIEECYYKGESEGWYADSCNKISNAWNLIAWKKGGK